jgi:hypothetical protein
MATWGRFASTDRKIEAASFQVNDRAFPMRIVWISCMLIVVMTGCIPIGIKGTTLAGEGAREAVPCVQCCAA